MAVLMGCRGHWKPWFPERSTGVRPAGQADVGAPAAVFGPLERPLYLDGGRGLAGLAVGPQPGASDLAWHPARPECGLACCLLHRRRSATGPGHCRGTGCCPGRGDGNAGPAGPSGRSIASAVPGMEPVRYGPNRVCERPCLAVLIGRPGKPSAGRGRVHICGTVICTRQLARSALASYRTLAASTARDLVAIDWPRS